MTPNVTIIAALQHEQLWRKWLGDDPRTWSAWFAFLRALFGLKLTAAERRIFTACTGRSTPRAGGYLEATLIVGRRGGKPLTLALIAVFLAAFKKWRGVAGERMVVVVCASTTRAVIGACGIPTETIVGKRVEIGVTRTDRGPAVAKIRII